MHVHRNAELPSTTTLPGIDHTTLACADLGAQHLSLWRQTMAPGAATPPHRHDCEEIVLVQSGRGQLIVEGRVVEFGPDVTLVLPAGVDHQIINTGDEPLHTIAAFAATPVGTALPDGQSIELPWRS